MEGMHLDWRCWTAASLVVLACLSMAHQPQNTLHLTTEKVSLPKVARGLHIQGPTTAATIVAAFPPTAAAVAGSAGLASEGAAGQVVGTLSSGPLMLLLLGAASMAAWSLAWLQRSGVPERQAAADEALEPMLMTMATTTALPPKKQELPGKSQAMTPTGTTKNSKIRNSLSIPETLKEFWFPVVFSKELSEDTLMPIEMFGVAWVVFRDETGAPACIRDECAHRACPISIGIKKDGEVACPYHGWTFNRDGTCTTMPSTIHKPGIKISALKCREGDGFVWVWPGQGDPAPELPAWTRPPAGYTVHCEEVFEVPVEHGLLIENLLDLAHAPFTHTTTFAKGWPIPDMVRFHTSRLLGGRWDPYPINMSFEPPCATKSVIGVEKPGEVKRGIKVEQCERHLWQLHVCLPATNGKTRLLYRMALDFWGFAKHVPFIKEFWKSVAWQVLSEDLPLVVGQQARMEVGGDVWANPVSYDKIGVRYRQWRNSIEEKDDAARQRIEQELRRPFSARELFLEGSAVQQRELH